MAHELSRTSIVIQGSRFAFHTSGVGAPLVLLHGWGQSADMWKNIIPILSRHFTVYALDLPGFGHSEVPSSAIELNGIAQQVRALLIHLNVHSTKVIGHSYGGRIALALADLYPVEHLILYNASDLSRHSLFRTINLWIARIGKLCAPTLLWWVHTSLLKPRSYRNHVSVTYREAARMLGLFIRTHEYSLVPVLKTQSHRSLRIVGARDRIVPPAIDSSADHPADTVFVTMKDGGHFAHIDAPDAFCKHVLSYMARKKRNPHLSYA